MTGNGRQQALYNLGCQMLRAGYDYFSLRMRAEYELSAESACAQLHQAFRDRDHRYFRVCMQ